MRRGVWVLLLLSGGCLNPPSYDGRPCGPGRTCPESFTCHIGDICRRTCSSAKPCPLIEEVCSSGVCIPRGMVGPRLGEGGPCEGTERLCTMPPDNECVGDDYRTYASTGTCDTATMTCLYAVTDVPCTNCDATCRSPCAALRCDDLEGGCRFNGRCEPDGLGGVECVYDRVDDGLTCTKSAGGSGVCTAGVCGECSGDLDCETSDLCFKGARCVQGACTGGQATVCDEPPDACHEVAGVCNPANGECSYTPVLNGTACDDEDMCVTGEFCTGGVCGGGTALNCDDTELCTTDSCSPAVGCIHTANTLPCNDGDLCTYGDVCGSGTCKGTTILCQNGPCVTRSCNGTNRCTESFASDGASCGGAPADRCCGGSCVDISTDARHCGGCSTPCATGLTCEPVSVTNMCSSAPADTSGRCRCQMANAQCPRGQLCRTFEPFTDRCTPPDASGCAPGTSLVAIGACPDYCRY